jgi:hypothetical protein
MKFIITNIAIFAIVFIIVLLSDRKEKYCVDISGGFKSCDCSSYEEIL